ncbi:MAG: DinB family protein [Ignavibacteriaceae bacterium]
MQRPDQGDYRPYQEAYIKTVEGNNILKVLEEQLISIPGFLKSIPEDKGKYSYADGKWTIKQVIEHLIDAERVFAYRALCIARGEEKTLPGFEPDDYANAANSNNRKLVDLIEEFRKVREANLSLFKSFSEDILKKKGNVKDYKITVNAILYVIAGHTNHHLNILRQKYLN